MHRACAAPGPRAAQGTPSSAPAGATLFRAVPLNTELKGCLTQARAAVPYAELAARLKLSEGALRVAVHRLRQRYRELLRAEIAHTVADAGEVEEELRYLFRVLTG